jgi:hypothetical protein
MRLLKSAVHALPYPVFLRLYYVNYFLRDMPRAERNGRMASFGQLHDVDLRKWKNSDTLFILGSGPSINEISVERWAAISNHDTIGINFWLYHRFVPTMYASESQVRGLYPQASVAYNSIAERRAEDYVHTLKIIFNMHLKGQHEVFNWPREWKRGFFTAPDLPLPARNETELEYGLRYLRLRHAFDRRNKARYVFRYCSTVTAVIALGMMLGYAKIVLCGIDLKAQEYFYQDPELYPQTANLEIVPRQAKHATIVAVPWRVPADSVILLMDRELLQPAGVQLYVENRSSALWPHVIEAPQEVFAAPIQISLGNNADCRPPARRCAYICSRSAES